MSRKRPDNLTAHTIPARGSAQRPEKKPKSLVSRPDLAVEFGKLCGEIVDVCWGVGSQQVRRPVPLLPSTIRSSSSKSRTARKHSSRFSFT